MTTYNPACIATWASQCAGMDDQSSYAARTVEQALADINHSKTVLAEIESGPMPLDEMTQLRKSVHEYIVRRAINEAQSVVDMRAVVEKARAA